MKFYRKYFLYPKRALLLSITILVMIITLTILVLYIANNSQSALELKRIQEASNARNVSITYTITNSFEYFSNQIFTDEGTVEKDYEIGSILDTVQSLQITDSFPWDELDNYGGGGCFLSIIIDYPDTSQLLFESNLKISRFTLTTPDGAIFKESCTFDTAELLSFVVAHDARD